MPSTVRKIAFRCAAIVLAGITLSACNSFLDREPLSQVVPEKFLTNASQLGAYAVNLYPAIPGSAPAGWVTTDNNTDNQAAMGVSNAFVPGEYRVPATGGSWSFDQIRQCSYFLKRVLPRYRNGAIGGNDRTIRHHIGEVFFLRACAYFGKLQVLGDFPIITEDLPDDFEKLQAATRRMPRNVVARFILSDLDSAITYLSEVSPVAANRTQIGRDVAHHFRSRVALYEGTWLKYHSGTARVPGGPGWPGRQEDLSFPSGSLQGEIDFFLSEAMKSAQLVADKYPLTPNDGGVPQPKEAPVPYPVGMNRYFEMFGDVDMSGYSEVLLWRQYKIGVVTNNISRGFHEDNGAIGVTRAAVESFLMADGKPIYASSLPYRDDYVGEVRQNRDNRLYLFLKEPGQYNLWINRGAGTHELNPIEAYPWITGPYGGREGQMVTGYALRKYMNPDAANALNGGSGIGQIVFRASEAYLNYIEASYERSGELDATALRYWKALRLRARLPEDPNVTILSTDMAQEAARDWGAYSGGALLADRVLYSIRRERRSELFSEGLRYEDLKRWRSFDQLAVKPFIVEGFKLWGPMQSWYVENGVSYLRYGSAANNNNVSPPPAAGGSSYLQPHRANTNNRVYNGYRWHPAHYLDPIAVSHFRQSTVDGNVAGSPIYQNPGWPVEANVGAQGS